MNGSQIERALRSDKLTNEVFVGVFAADTLPEIKEFPGGYIANTDDEGQSGEHWVAFFCSDGAVESFDSFGENPAKYSQHIEKWLQSIHNTVQSECLQSKDSTVCGQYCMFFILLRSHGYSYQDVISALTKRTRVNDLFVCKFINKYFRLKTTVRDNRFLIESLLKKNY